MAIFPKFCFCHFSNWVITMVFTMMRRNLPTLQLPRVIYSKGLLLVGSIHVVLMQCNRITSSTWGNDHRCIFLLPALVACIGKSQLDHGLMSPLARLYTRLRSFSSRSIRYGISQISDTNLVARHCTFSKWSTSANLIGAHTVLAYSKWPLTRDLNSCINIC